MEAVEKELRRFVVDNFLFGQKDGFMDDDSLLEKGIIDSTGVLELVAFLEKKYKIDIEDEDLVPENLDSIINIVRFVKTKMSRS
ncbi:Acyl carrier protein [hydrothermal vent metagenome]|uniref:Acyl carrier protein n=1 Tax=hydrothermal vent metagenome TaxID=652676 RepID=A0A3B1D912_9ZZZZ